MERRYLVAALAIIATFAVVSHGFRVLQQMSCLHERHFGAMALSFPHPMARAVAKARPHFHHASPDEVQLLAEMNIPTAEQTARQESMAQCARAQAMRDVERARRETARMQNRMAHISVSAEPIAMDINVSPDFQQTIREQTAAANAMANVQLQIAAEKLRESSTQMALSGLSMANTGEDIPVHVVTRVRSNITAIQVQTQQAVRDALRQVQSGFVGK